MDTITDALEELASDITDEFRGLTHVSVDEDTKMVESYLENFEFREDVAALATDIVSHFDGLTHVDDSDVDAVMELLLDAR